MPGRLNRHDTSSTGSVLISSRCLETSLLDRSHSSKPKEANREHTWKMLQSMNVAMDSEALSEERLRRYFDTFWPSLDAELQQVNLDLQTLPAGGDYRFAIRDNGPGIDSRNLDRIFVPLSAA